jgi:hypothetical protein
MVLGCKKLERYDVDNISPIVQRARVISNVLQPVIVALMVSLQALVEPSRIRQRSM